MSFQQQGPDDENRKRRQGEESKDNLPHLSGIPAELRNIASLRDEYSTGAGLHVDFGRKLKEWAVSRCAPQPGKEFHIRWMLDSDLSRVAEIDRGSFKDPWNKEDWSRARKSESGVGLVTEIGEQVVGCCLYKLCPDHFALQRLAVCPSFLRQGLGFAAIRKLFDKLTADRRTYVLATVQQDDLLSQKFFRASGFRAIPDTTDTKKGGTSQEHYLFRADLGEILRLEEQARARCAQHRVDSSGADD